MEDPGLAVRESTVMKLPVQKRYVFLTELHDRLERIAAPQKLVAYFLRRSADLFAAEGGGAWLHDRVSDRLERVAAFGSDHGLEESRLRALLLGHRPAVPETALLVPLATGHRLRGVVALSRPSRAFERSDERFLAKSAARVGEEIRRREQARLRDLSARIEGKLLEDLRPEDVVYRILHGLRALLGYDHSSAVWLLDETRDRLLLKAEQIAWKKAKSERIGRQVLVSDEAVQALARGEAACLFRSGPERAGRNRPLLDLVAATAWSDAAPEEGAVLLAPLRYRSRPIGLLKVVSRRSTAFDEEDLAVVRAFSVPSAAALHRSQAHARLETTAVRAERKSALADVARAVAHAVNNAVGAALPMVQQMLDEADAGRAPEPQALRDDLEQVLASLCIVKRVFSGMLGFARDARSRGPVDVNRCVMETLALLEGSLARGGLRLETSLADGLALVVGNSVLLEQVRLTLVGNARDATPRGGAIRVTTAPADEAIALVVEDSGVGMAPGTLEQVGQPFYTTKPEGSGLGLAICRSILEDMGGRFSIASEPGRGTRVHLLLPTLSGAASTGLLVGREGERP